MKRAYFAALLMAASVFTTSIHAQSYAIDWFTIDGGGGVSTSGVFSISGTIGQPDAGVMSGGQYSLNGGYWGIVTAVQTPGAPLLSIQQVGGGVRVFWLNPATDWLLDQSLTVTGAWSQVAFPYTTNATDISVSTPAPTGNRFYRLRRPRGESRPGARIWVRNRGSPEYSFSQSEHPSSWCG